MVSIALALWLFCENIVIGLFCLGLGGVIGAVFVVMLLMFLLGFILDFIEITFVVVPIVGPILLAMDLNPVWLGVMIALNLQTSFLTPPFGFSLFYLRGVAPKEVTTMHIYKGVMPFIVIQVITLALIALWPQLATWLPKVVYG
jgi:TRAP-type mannitol/chloroaromatic compound transport system permease large subunit